MRPLPHLRDRDACRRAAACLSAACFLAAGLYGCGASTGGRSIEPATSEVPAASLPSHLRRAEIPFRLVDDHIVIRVVVNDARELDMIVDTGFGTPGAVLFDPELGEELGLRYVGEATLGGAGSEGREGGRSARVATGATLSLPDSEIRFREQTILALNDPGPFRDPYADGIIGATLFSHVATIDYERSKIYLHPELPPERGLGTSFALDFVHGIPVVEATLLLAPDRRLEADLMLDTGVNDPLLIFSYAREDLRYEGKTIRGTCDVLGEGISGEVRGSVGRITALELGAHRLEEIVTAFPREESMGPALALGQEGMIGNEILKRFRVTFDYAGRRVYLEPNANLDEPFEFNTAGLFLQGGRSSYEVKDVVPGSSGARLGVRRGDHLVAIDGRPVAEFMNSEIARLFERQGVAVELTLRRDGELKVIKIPLWQLI